MFHRFAGLAPVLMLLLVAGCAGSVHVVQEARSGGTLALHGPEEGARAKADEHMKARCPDGYEIVEQGESIELDGEREWQITYACAARGPKAASAAL